MAWMIDGNKLKEKAVPLLIPSEMELSGFLPNPAQAVMVSEIEGMLYRDGIEIIRCKDCASYGTDGCAEGFGWCALHDRGKMDFDFCSCGGRRGYNAAD